MALWIYYADTIIASISHDDVPVAIQCDPPGTVEPSSGSFSVSMALFASACQSGHMTLWSYFADTMVAFVGHDDVAVRIHCDSRGPVEMLNNDGGPFSVSMPLVASARYCGHLVHTGARASQLGHNVDARLVAFTSHS
jgi:hypothetical protein